jgi:hypothetical protein
MKIESKADLEKLRSDGIEESRQLEYKSGRSLGRDERAKIEITKDVSAFANAAGGTIIYGIGEAVDGRHLSGEYEPVDAATFSKEWLDQILSLIQPKIEQLHILPIHLGPADLDYGYVVNVSQSGTAHQALDRRYYRRRNFESTPMDDYEVREVMNRRKSPVIDAQVRVAAHPQEMDSLILVRLTNTSAVLARSYRLVLKVPLQLSSGVYIRPDDGLIFGKEGEEYWEVKMHNALKSPLFPDCQIEHRRKFEFVASIEQRNGTPTKSRMKHIEVIIHADEMKPVRLEKSLTAAEKDWA